MPVVAETTTKAPENTTKAPETTTTKTPEATTSAQQQGETPTNLAPGIIATPETTTLSNANQIFLDDQNGGGNIGGSVAVSDSNATVLMAIFAVLATFGMAMIAVSAFMLSGMKPAGLTKGGNGRARQKKRV